MMALRERLSLQTNNILCYYKAKAHLTSFTSKRDFKYILKIWAVNLRRIVWQPISYKLELEHEYVTTIKCNITIKTWDIV